jgi:hypothetical protein
MSKVMGEGKTVDQRDDSFNQEYPSIPYSFAAKFREEKWGNAGTFPLFSLGSRLNRRSLPPISLLQSSEKKILGEHRDTSLVFPGFQAEPEESDLLPSSSLFV